MSKADTKRIDVMISSTSIDLPDHRQQAIDAILRAGTMHPIMMETLSATVGDAISVSLKMVDKAEIYVGIFGMRYGYIPEDEERNPDEISITEMEYRRAVKRDIPILIYLMNEDEHPVPKSIEDAKNFFEQTEDGKEKLEAFKKELKTNHVVGFFKSPEELRGLLIQSLNDPDVIAKAREKAGELDHEVEPDENNIGIPKPPILYSHPAYTLTNTFIGRTAELKALDDWAKSDDSVMVWEAIGGMGKSALTWQWINDRVTMSEFKGIFWYSFYEGGANMRGFIRHALAYISQVKPSSLKGKNLDEMAQELLALLQTGRYLLILDGFERVLVAYHRWNAAQMRDDEVDEGDENRSHKACTDPRDSDFLRKLVACGKSKVLVSTRLMPSTLEEDGDPLPQVKHKKLNGLHPTDAIILMKDRGVKRYDPKNLDDFMKQFGYHSLLLKMLAGRIKNHRRARGDFDAWYAMEGHNLRLHELDMKNKRTHILQYAFAGLSDEKRKLLSQIAAFSDGVSYDTVSVFNPYLKPKPEEVSKPSESFMLRHYRKQLENAKTDEERESAKQRVDDLEAQFAEEQAAYEAYLAEQEAYPKSDEYRKALSQFDEVLTELEERGLLQWDRDKDSYDLHPVVRGYAFGQLEESERVTTFDSIRNFFEGQEREDPEQAIELSDLKHTIAIYRALLGAGKLDEAARFYGERLANVLHQNIAAYHTIVELLTPLFPDGTDTFPVLSDKSRQSNSMVYLANIFGYLGRIDEALVLQGLQIKLMLEQKSASSLGVGLRNYASSLRSANNLEQSLRTRKLTLDLAEVTNNSDGQTMSYLKLLFIYKDTGQWTKAEAAYQAFTENPPNYQTVFWQSVVEIYYAEMLIYQDKDVHGTLDKAEKLAQESNNIMGLRQIQRLRGEIALQADKLAAAEYFQNAIAMARKAGSADTATYLGCLARVRAKQGKHDEARRIIGEALEQTYKEDIHDLYCNAAEVYLALGEKEKAKEYAILAYKQAWADGPPHSWWYTLEKAKKLLNQLGEPYPDMPAFDPDKVEKIPHEDEIRAFIEELRAKKEE